MVSPIKRRARAAEYRDLARRAAEMAAASSLDRVREKHEAAAIRLSMLAAMDESPRGLRSGSPPARGQ